MKQLSYAALTSWSQKHASERRSWSELAHRSL